MVQPQIIELDKVGELVQTLVNEAYERGDMEFTFTIPLRMEGQRKVQIAYFPMDTVIPDKP